MEPGSSEWDGGILEPGFVEADADCPTSLLGPWKELVPCRPGGYWNELSIDLLGKKCRGADFLGVLLTKEVNYKWENKGHLRKRRRPRVLRRGEGGGAKEE